MAYTVIGIFEHSHQLDDALNSLALNNFSKDNITVSQKEEIQGRGDATDENGTLGSKAGAYFKNIFSDEKMAFQYAAVAQQGTIVTVHCETYDSARRAADILDECGALDVNERARHLEDAMTRDERLTGNPSEELRIYPGINEYNKDATPAQLANEEKSRKARMTSGVNRSRSSIVDRSTQGFAGDRANDYIDDPDSEYVNPSDEEKNER